jgi:hypothetical protein
MNRIFEFQAAMPDQSGGPQNANAMTRTVEFPGEIVNDDLPTPDVRQKGIYM